MHISYQKKNIHLGKVLIPGSKSESNRALLINALCKVPGSIKNLSSARDTELMKFLLGSTSKEIDVKDAGTVMRFLTAFFGLTGQHKILTGTARMQERPIGILVNALRELGVEIDYLKKEGYPPISLNGFETQKTDTITIDGSVSSQYLSALLMLAPILPKGLALIIEGETTSKPYLQMTIELMQHFGVDVEELSNGYKVHPAEYVYTPFTVEPDWSSASYWYSIFVLSGAEHLELAAFKENSLQGDRNLVELMRPFGVETQFTFEGAVLTRCTPNLPEAIDFSDSPDLAQTFAVLCAALEHSCVFTGLHTLKIKETDRVAAIKNELQKLGADFIEENETWTVVPPKGNWKGKEVYINTYHDHRMAMAFAPLACVLPGITIEAPEVVNKSYPSFWEDLEKVGFVNR
ncbi:MAG: 3-phosphoshikimate 1-carboxyvinyltransferase [Cyclobacteriaceae bacterium]|nr:3-phosphoshikimate 1-carboxyvinyltransferase [Cyclobacteriaceae bacterium]